MATHAATAVPFTARAKPRLTFWEIWNMSFGFLGIQIGFALQNANVSRGLVRAVKGTAVAACVAMGLGLRSGRCHTKFNCHPTATPTVRSSIRIA